MRQRTGPRAVDVAGLLARVAQLPRHRRLTALDKLARSFGGAR